MKEFFRTFAFRASDILGSSSAFVVGVVLILLWVATGPLFGFSDTWQLVVSSITSIATLLMVILVQNTQNRDTKAIQLKLDELIRGVRGARTGRCAWKT